MARRKLARPHAHDARGREYKPQYAVAVVCRDEPEQRRLYRRLRRAGLEPKVLVL